MSCPKHRGPVLKAAKMTNILVCTVAGPRQLEPSRFRTGGVADWPCGVYLIWLCFFVWPRARSDSQRRCTSSRLPGHSARRAALPRTEAIRCGRVCTPIACWDACLLGAACAHRRPQHRGPARLIKDERPGRACSLSIDKVWCGMCEYLRPR